MGSIVPELPHGGPPAAPRAAAVSLAVTWWPGVQRRSLAPPRALGFHSLRWAASRGLEEHEPRLRPGEGEGPQGFACCLHLKVCWARERLFRCLASAPATSRLPLAGPSLRGSPSRGAAPWAAPHLGLTSGLLSPPCARPFRLTL